MIFWSHLWPKISSKEFLVIDCDVWDIMHDQYMERTLWVLAVSEDSILVYCTLPSHPSLLSKVQTSFSVTWVRIKCIHKFILWVNWSGFDTFCPIFPGAHCQVRLPWFTLPKSVRLPILWVDKMFRTFRYSSGIMGKVFMNLVWR